MRARFHGDVYKTEHIYLTLAVHEKESKKTYQIVQLMVPFGQQKRLIWQPVSLV